MRVLLVGDIHLADRPPSVRRETYAEDILAKLEFTVGLASEEEVDAVVWAGDVFHIKTPSRTSHMLVQRTAAVGQSYGRPWLIVPGNHDLRHDRLDTLPEQPLGVLYKAGAVPLIGRPDPSLPLFGIPYLWDWKRDLPGHMRAWAEDDASLLVTHAPIVPPGVSLPYEVIDAAEWATAMERPGHVYYGHMHHCDGAYRVGENWFCNQGALSRGSLHEETLARKPAVTVWEARPGAEPFRRVEVPHRAVEEVFHLAEKAKEDARLEKLDGFLEAVGSTTFDRLSVEGVLADIETRGLGPATLAEIRSCLEEAMST